MPAPVATDVMDGTKIQFLVSLCFAAIDAVDPLGHFEGDINVAGLDMNLIGLKDVDQLKSVLKDPALIQKSRWDKRVVPYNMSDAFAGRHRRIIKKAMADFHRRTCVRFVERTTEKDYLYITPGLLECNSFVGKTGGVQYVYFRMPDCERRGKIQHELMHALGFFHEQSRMDRDDYIEIKWDNIEKDSDDVENQANFEKYVDVEIHEFGQPYDFASVMHYGSKDFAIDKSSYVIKPKPQFADREIGQRRRLSDFDVVRINMMYECDNIPVMSTVKSVPSAESEISTVTSAIPSDEPPTTKSTDEIVCKLDLDTSCSRTRDRILDQINGIRKKQEGANMKKVQWDDDLMNLAQTQADQCKDQQQKQAAWSGWKVAVATANWSETFAEWLGTQELFPATCGSSERTKNYPLIVWAKIDRIGCGYSACRGNFFFCFFGPRLRKKQLVFGPEQCTPYLPRSPNDGPCGACGGPQSEQCDDGLCLALSAEKE